jgi:hypothetical protein
MHGPINVKSPNNTSKWQMGFNSAFKGLIKHSSHFSKRIFRGKKLLLANISLSIKSTALLAR